MSSLTTLAKCILLLVLDINLNAAIIIIRQRFGDLWANVIHNAVVCCAAGNASSEIASQLYDYEPALTIRSTHRRVGVQFSVNGACCNLVSNALRAHTHSPHHTAIVKKSRRAPSEGITGNWHKHTNYFGICRQKWIIFFRNLIIYNGLLKILLFE
jgi:hypothetical protein